MNTMNANDLEARSAAAVEIGQLATRIVKLAPIAGLHVGITIKPALVSRAKDRAHVHG